MQPDKAKIKDGRLDTKWTSGGGKAWIQVDMKKSHYVHRVHIEMAKE